MARKIDPNSVRQRAFKLLDTMTDIKLNKIVEVLKKTYSIETSYATSLWAAHRRINKKNGTMVQVYSVRDIKQGKIVAPYIKVESVFNPSRDACLHPDHAKARYALELKSRIAKSKQL